MTTLREPHTPPIPADPVEALQSHLPDSFGRRMRKTARSLARSGTAMFGLCVLLLVAFLAIFAPWITPHEIGRINLTNRFAPPVWADGGSFLYALGTDQHGRDILSRLIYGARMTLIVATAAVLLGGTVGFAMGLLAGYRGGVVDSVIMRLVDLQLAFPSLFIGLVAMGLLGAGVVQLVCVIALTQWADYARIARGEVLKVRETPYVEGARAMGLSDWRIVRLYITPNVISSLVIVATFSLAVAIYYESALSFFGLGVPPSIPTWGNMLSQARDLMLRTPWLAVFPGLAITLTVLSFNLLGDWLRDYLDVKLRQ